MQAGKRGPARGSAGIKPRSAAAGRGRVERMPDAMLSDQRGQADARGGRCKRGWRGEAGGTGELSTRVVEVKVYNIMASFDLGAECNLPRITWRLRNAEFVPPAATKRQNDSSGGGGGGRGGSGTIRFRKPKATLVVRSTGRVTIMGAECPVAARHAALKLVRLLRRLGGYAELQRFRVDNVMAGGFLGFPVDLEALYQRYYQFAEYEPELKPFLVFRLVRPHVTVMVFASGSVTLTKGRSTEDLREAMVRVYPAILECAKRHSVRDLRPSGDAAAARPRLAGPGEAVPGADVARLRVGRQVVEIRITTQDPEAFEAFLAVRRRNRRRRRSLRAARAAELEAAQRHSRPLRRLLRDLDGIAERGGLSDAARRRITALWEGAGAAPDGRRSPSAPARGLLGGRPLRSSAALLSGARLLPGGEGGPEPLFGGTAGAGAGRRVKAECT